MDNVILKMSKSKFNKNLEDIREYVEYLEGSNRELRNEMKNFRAEDEIKILEDRNRELVRNSIHILSTEEKEEYDKFCDEHRTKCERVYTSYVITGTGIGTNIAVKCNICGEEKDITDYTNW